MGEEDTTSFSAQLRRYRKRAGLTQEVLAEKAGLGVNTVGNLERDVSQPYRETVKALASALELSAQERIDFAAAAGRRGSMSIRDAQAESAHETGASDGNAHAGRHTVTPQPLAAVAQRPASPLSTLREYGRRHGMRRAGLLLAAAIAAVALTITVIAWPRQVDHAGVDGPQPDANGVACGVEAGWPVLCMRSRGVPVYALQYLLNGYKPTYGLIVDGIYGSRTRHAVQDFQAQNRLRRDVLGIAGARTWFALAEQEQAHPGSNGAAVQALQYLLNHYPRASYPYKLAVDGAYGPKTQGAVQDFEASARLHTAGVMTPKAWRALVCAASSACQRWTRSHPTGY